MSKKIKTRWKHDNNSFWSYSIDTRHRTEYIQVRGGVVAYTRELRNGLLVDLDRKGNILGIELLDTKR